MHNIAIISDTHGLLRDEVLSALQGCEAILHAGDIGRQEILDRLEETAPVYAVRGNTDIYWAQHIPYAQDITLFGLHIFMTHRQSDLPPFVSVFDLVVYGHSHRYEYDTEGRTVLINPGSCGPRRFRQDITMAMLTVSDTGLIHGIRRIDLQETSIPADPAMADGAQEHGLKRDITRVIRAVDKGKSVSQIARTLHINEGLTEQICRLYLTHPGVDADGIMKKMGL